MVYTGPSSRSYVLTVGLMYVLFKYLDPFSTADFEQFEYERRTLHDGFASSPGFRVGGESYSNFMASTVRIVQRGYRAMLEVFWASMWSSPIRVAGGIPKGSRELKTSK